MRRIPKILVLLTMLLPMQSVLAQNDRVIQRVFLVGDAGEIREGKHPVCDWLKEHIDWNDTSNVLLYLGDNIYPQGMPPEGSKDRDIARKILDYQLSVVEGKKAKAFFIPGNHDWKQGAPGGWERIKSESAYFDSLNLPNVQFFPKNGCPGPVEFSVGEKMVLVFMDSQWWLQQYERPGPGSGCDCKTEDEIIIALKDIIGSNPGKLILLAMHHAFYTHGEHGGYYTIKQHIFPLTDFKTNLYIPLPVIGSIFPIGRGVFGNIQDTRHPQYKDLIQKVEAVIKGHRNVVHVAGHEHTLQFLEHDSTFFVVSGAGSKHTRVKKGRYSLFAREGLGFAMIELRESGKTSVQFYSPDAAGLDQPLYTAALHTLEPVVEDVATVAASFPDSVTVVGDAHFGAGPVKKFFFGANYRKEWGTPVRVKVFDMSGWTPLRRGGGLQTRSLRLENKDGKQYVIRGVKKYVTDAALPAELQGTFVKDIVSDGVSASYPYAALSIPPFAAALGIPHASPQLYFIPDDPRLGKFRSDYANTFNLFEEREPGSAKKTLSTDELDRKLQEDNDNVVDGKKALQARLLDMFVMDFDRHEDQWRWAGEDNGKGKTYSPVPRDRDQPFFINEGAFPWLAGSAFITPQLQGFRSKARNINTYNYNARNFDRNYLSALAEKDWREAAEALVARMTDSLIGYALSLQPPEVYSYSAASIVAKLKARRKYFVGEAMTYYKFLSETVSVYGSDKKELFDVQREADGGVTLVVYKLNKEGGTGKELFRRKFVAGETREIRLYGLGGDDRFVTHGVGGGAAGSGGTVVEAGAGAGSAGGAASSGSGGAAAIRVRIIGGSGDDVFDNGSDAPAGKTKIYDLATEKNQFSGKGNYRSFLSDDPAVNAVNRLGFKYDVLAPFLDVSYNPDDGVFLGAQFRYTVQGFHKEPYKQLHQFSIEHALATKAYNFKYNFEAIHAIGKLDLLFNTNVKAPDNTINFFSYGNESFYDKSGGKTIKYYRTRFDEVDVALMLRARSKNGFFIEAGPLFQYFSIDSNDNKGRFITLTNLNGLDPATLYRSKSYAGLGVNVGLDQRNDKVMPGRGVNWQTGFSTYKGLGSVSHDYSRIHSELSLFTSLSREAGLVISTRVGWGRTFGKYEFFQAQYLSGTENLRGYRKYRFGGDELFYHNLDLRIKLGDFQTYLFPGSIGLLAFNDIGRVWVKGENSHQWHDGYGGGVWISPLKRFVITASYAQSPEGGVTLITWGFLY
ncbi:MAG TPA: BamA/TamA family outer membrane protein [Puia sp.]|nr:BamA/TamA family outer membrane protein [Puia sp.]